MPKPESLPRLNFSPRLEPLSRNTGDPYSIPSAQERQQKEAKANKRWYQRKYESLTNRLSELTEKMKDPLMREPLLVSTPEEEAEVSRIRWSICGLYVLLCLIFVSLLVNACLPPPLRVPVFQGPQFRYQIVDGHLVYLGPPGESALI